MRRVGVKHATGGSKNGKGIGDNVGGVRAGGGERGEQQRRRQEGDVDLCLVFLLSSSCDHCDKTMPRFWHFLGWLSFPRKPTRGNRPPHRQTNGRPNLNGFFGLEERISQLADWLLDTIRLVRHGSSRTRGTPTGDERAPTNEHRRTSTDERAPHRSRR